MKLSEAGKNKLLDSANKIYLAYTALDFFKTRTFVTSGGNKSIYDLCNQALADKKLDQTVLINGINYKLILTPGKDNTYKVHFARPISSSVNSVVHKISAYEDQDALNLLANQEFTLEIPDDGGAPAVSNRINQDYVIGGIGKVDLYRTHLVTLHNIIEKISSETDVSNLLVALATGSGKTFVQALWMMVLSLSDNNGVFAVPDKLATQFAKDLKRLLPDSFVNKMLILRDKENNPQIEEALNALEHPTGKGKIIIGSTERLLDQHYQDLLKADSEHTFLAFDEQHLIMKAERRRVRLIELSKNKMSMFLTATPNQETYDLSGNKPVAIMSSGQKQEAGQGQFPHLYTHHARNITDRNKLKHFRFWTGDFWQNMLNGFLLRVTNSIQEEQSSAAVSLVEDLPFFYHRKEGETNVRWRMQVPAARKMLCIIDDNESLVNFCYALQHAPAYRRDVYRNGNVIKRADVANFFQIPDAEVDVIRKDMEDKRRDYLASFQNDEQAIGNSLAHKTLAGQLKDNIFHNLIEYVLTDITGLDEIEHNRLRKLNMEEFNQLVISRFKLRTADYYQQKLAKEIDAKGAEVIGELLGHLSGVFESMIAGNFSNTKAENDKNLADFIDNWSLYDGLINRIKRTHYEFGRKFENYARSHLTMGIMTGMKNAETPVEESRPFAGLNEHTYSLYDNDGTKVSNAKKRKNTSLEILNDTSVETTFTPAYLNISEDQTDAYFRLGFTGALISNKKTEGFSDRGLHTVVNISEEKLGATNSPDTQIQGIGRNRGLDDTIEPAYIHSLGRNQKTLFDLEHLKSDDYYPDLFKAQQQYNKEFIAVLGAQVSKKIIAWIYANLDKDETINPDRLKRQVLKFIAQALRELNNKNSHQIKLSRAQLADVVAYAMTDIDKEIEHLKEPYKLSFLLGALGTTLNFISECYYTTKSIPAAAQIFYHSWFGKRTSDQSKETPKHADDVYIKILNKTSFKGMVSNMSSVLELKNWLTKKIEGIDSSFKKNVENYMKPEALADLKTQQQLFLEPLLAKMVIDSKREQVVNALATFPQFISLFYINKGVLVKLLESDNGQFEPTLLAFFKQIPGLEDFVISDIVNYPKNMANIQALITNQPLKILEHYPDLRNDLSRQLADYLKGDFLKHLSALVVYPQLKKMQQILGKDNNSQRFIKHCLSKLIEGELDFSSESFFNELKSFFKLDEFHSLAEEIEMLKNEISDLQVETKDNFFQLLDERHVTSLTNLIKELLPISVLVYPLENRSRLLLEASDSIKIRRLITEHGAELFSHMENNKEQLPEFIFSKLTSSPLPTQIDTEQQIKAAQEFFAKKINEIMLVSVSSLLFSKLTSPLSWSLSPQYLYDVAIADVLQSDDFLNSISIMLPHNQWLQLRDDIQNDYSGTLSIARLLIDKKTNGELTQLTPDVLLTMFNEQFDTQYMGTQEAIKKVSETGKDLAKKITDNPMAALNQNMKDKYAQLAVGRLLPLLASFIKEDLKKEHFLVLERDNKKLYEFITQNSAALSSFTEQNEDQVKQNALNLINQLLPEGSRLVLTDIINPATQALDSAEKLGNDIKKLTLISFISSNTFSELMNDFLSSQDFALLKAYISLPENIEGLADQMIAQGIDSLDKESIINIIKSSDPSLEKIATMDERAKEFLDLLSGMTNNLENILDKNKMSGLIADAITPVLFHKKFSSVIDEMIGFLNEQDLIVLFEAMDRPDPASEAKQLIQFMSLVRAQDKEGLKQEFMSLPADLINFDIDKLPAKKVIENIKDLILEVLDCHCYYNQQDRKGTMGRGTEPKIINKISPELRDIRISASYGFFDNFSRKIFYIQGIRNGLKAGGEINADSNEHIVKLLQRVKMHILRPLWWGTNVSNFSHWVIKSCRDMVNAIVAAYYGIVNIFKSVLNWIIRREYFNVSPKHADSEDYNNTAFDFAREVNDLDPLDAEEVKKKECKNDVVEDLEDFVAKRPARPGFFPGVNETPVSPSDEEATDFTASFN